MLSKWLVSLSLAAPPAFVDGDSIEALVREIEGCAIAASIVPDVTTAGNDRSDIDAVFVNFHYSDHMDEQTLRTFNARIPVFATAEAAATIRGWKHFDTVRTTHDLDPADPDWRKLHPGFPLPDWLNVFRLVGHHELNFATAIVFSPSENQHEVILYSPHGIRSEQPSVQAFLRTTPSVSTLAMLHALKDGFAWGIRTTLGVSGGLALERLVKPKYWVKSHDSPLKYQGLVMLGVQDIFRSLDWGLEEEKKEKKSKGENGDLRRPNFVEVENGACFVLE